jgi:putative ABC transport system permease protein
VSLYARLLALLPRDFVEEYGADMLVTFAERARDSRRRGRVRHAFWCMREVVGLVSLLRAERAASGVRGRGEGLRPMAEWGQGIGHAARRLARTPGFSAAAVVTLALAIGANAALFTLIERVVLSPLPYAEADRLLALDHAAPGLDIPAGLGMATGTYREYAKLPSHESVAIYTRMSMTLSGAGSAERLNVLLVTPSLGDVLKLQPALGRWFTVAEGERDADGVVVLTHAFWRDRMALDRGVLSRTVDLDGRPFRIIGVMPEGFAFPDDRPQLVLPLQLDLAAARPGGFNFSGVARLAAGVSVAQARRDHDRVISDLPARFPEHDELAASMLNEARLSSVAVSLKEQVLGGSTRMLWVLLASAAIVLFIACANVANLFLVRADARHREVAVRRALGAGTARIAGHFVAEAMLVCGLAGLLAIPVAHAAVEAVRTTSLVRLPRVHEVEIGGETVFFIVAVAVLAGFVFGLLPLLRSMPAVAPVLQDSARGQTAGRRQMRVRHGLMAAQVSFAVMLLVAAGLLVRSFDQLRSVDPGFHAQDRLTFRIGLSETEFRDNASTVSFHEQLIERVSAVPGVQQVALTTTLPLQGDGWGDPFEVRGRVAAPGVMNPIVRVRRVTQNYFDVMSIPLRTGRRLDTVDAAGGTTSAVVNEAFVRLYFPDDDPIGRQVRTFGSEEDQWITIVGVVGNTATYRLGEEVVTPKLYLTLRTLVAEPLPTAHNVSYVVRASSDPFALIPSLRRAVTDVHPHVALAAAEPLTELVARSQAMLAFTMILLVSAAGVALVLGLVGVYAVISYSVAMRRGEIGVRIALGAEPRAVTGMIMRQSGVVIGAGIAVGLTGAAAGARTMRALLFGISPNDVATYVAAAVVLFLVALAASWLPARRAAAVDPLRAL